MSQSAAAAGEEGYGGGIGGKFRRRPLRRAPATPYDRPPAAARGIRGNSVEAAAAAARRNGWLSKLVDPASRLISRGATRFFSSVFQKRLGPPSPPAEPPAAASFEPRQDAPDSVGTDPLPEIPVQGSKDDCDLKNNSKDDGITELEQLLKRKTFTRAEFDHLTELLRSRTVELPEEDARKAFEPRTLMPAGDYKNADVEIVSGQENEIENSNFAVAISTPVTALKIRGEEIASPAEVAKAYMGSRPAKISLSTSSLRNQLIREPTASSNFIGIASKPSAGALNLRPVNRLPGVAGNSENGYVSSRSRGRSAIYKMSRSPFFKGPSTISLKGSELIEAGPSTSNQQMTTSALSGDRQALKRRSSVIESDIGSFGPIRRIRQKSNLASPSKDTTILFSGKLLPTTTNALNNIQTSTSSAQMPPTPNEPKYDTPHWNAADNGDEKGGDFSVPRQSTEMARKILEQLGKIAPSPKEKSSEAKTISMHESPPKLTINMLHGQALKSVTEIDSSKAFNAYANGKVDNAEYSLFGGSVSSKHDKVRGNGLSKVSPSELKMESEDWRVESELVSVADARPIKGPNSIFPHSAAGLLQKKPAFSMQAPEDFLELEDESNNSRDDASGSSATGKGKTEASIKESTILISEDQVRKKPFPFSSESKVASGLTLSKEAGKGFTDRLAVADKGTGFTFQVAPSQSQPPLTPTMPSLAVEKSSPLSEQITAPTFTFSSKTTSLTCPSMTSFTEPTSLKFGVKTDLKGPLFGSSTAGTATTPVGSESSKSDTTKAGDFFKTTGAPSSSALMNSNTSNASLFTSSATSSQSNGSLASTTSIFSVSAAAPATSLLDNSADGIFSGTSASSSASSITTIAPSTSPAMTFQIGAGSAVSTNSVSSIVKSSSTSSVIEPVKESSFGIISSAAATPSSIGTGMFGFGASASSSASDAADSIFGTQVTKVGSGTSPFAQSMASQFGTSSSPAFGLGGPSFGLGSSAFGSSTSTAKPSLVSSSAFGQSSTTSSIAVAGSSAPSGSSFPRSATSPSLFGSSSQSTTSPVFGSVFGSSSSSPAIFTSASSSTASAPMVFGSSSSSPLTFSSSTPATSSSASATTLFGASSSSSAFSSSAPATSSIASATTLFGASSSSPLSFSSSAPATSSAFLFSQTTTASSPTLSFTAFGTTTSSASLSPSVPAFGIPTPTMGFGAATPGSDQMNVEDSMADDTAQATMASVPSFGQQPNVPGSNMPFGSPATPSGAPAFQFASQQPSAFPQSPFQATGSFEFGGSFSMGSGGGDKSGRRIIKAKRDKHRKK